MISGLLFKIYVFISTPVQLANSIKLVIANRHLVYCLPIVRDVGNILVHCHVLLLIAYDTYAIPGS